MAPRTVATSAPFAPVSTTSGASATLAPLEVVSFTVVMASSGRSENQNLIAAGAVATVSFAAGAERSKCRCATSKS